MSQPQCFKNADKHQRSWGVGFVPEFKGDTQAMRNSFKAVGAVLLLVSIAGAADVPKMEGFLGYNYVRFNPNSDFFSSFNANGGGGQFVYNVNEWIGGVFDMGAVTNGSLFGSTTDTTVLNFVAGPRFSYRRYSRFTPFAQVLFGGAYSTTSVRVISLRGAVLPPGIVVPPDTAITARLNASHTGFAMMAGGGLDIKVNDHISVRPVGVDYYLTQIPSLLSGDTSNRNNFRYSAGVNFLFGAR
jgi:opacity protein-like surface antigen